MSIASFAYIDRMRLLHHLHPRSIHALDVIRRMVGARSSPFYGAGFHLDVGCGMHEEAVGVAAQETFAVTWTLVVDAALVGGLFLQCKRHLVEIDTVDLFGRVAAYKDAVFARTADIVEVDMAHFAARTFRRAFRETPACIFVVTYGTGVGGDVDGFRLAPPHV